MAIKTSLSSSCILASNENSNNNNNRPSRIDYANFTFDARLKP